MLLLILVLPPLGCIVKLFATEYLLPLLARLLLWLLKLDGDDNRDDADVADNALVLSLFFGSDEDDDFDEDFDLWPDAVIAAELADEDDELDATDVEHKDCRPSEAYCKSLGPPVLANDGKFRPDACNRAR